ncbi:hypothetical protein [Actinomyces respiraculi]|uniref:Uncharacterized protein n=1 Tax=Actinomyces respiraculi TaxID=2744574 RepID=A0A7T0LJM7_9ACTO|nr:hypothetical protein [Actinomyces respiraculi]QPL05011.1 hypothetical protein ID810_09720 [Actinomyces respiraculi]
MLWRVRRGESGAGTVVYAGVVVVVVILVGALATGMTPVGRDIANGVSNEICKIFGGACGGSEQAGSAGQESVDPRRPGECVVSSHKDGVKADAKIGVVKIGPNHDLLTQREQYYDPETGKLKIRYRVVAANALEEATGAGVGTKGELANSGIGADLSLESTRSARIGETWEFDSEEEMNSFVDQYRDYHDRLRMVADPLRAGYALLTGSWPQPPRHAERTSYTLKTGSLANGDAGLRFGKDNEETKEKSVNPNVGLYAKASYDKSLTVTRDHRPDHEGEYSLTTTYEGTIGGGANAVFVGVGGTGSYTGTITYNFKPGPNGLPQLSSVTFNQITSGDLTWTGSNKPLNKVGDKEGTASGEGTLKQSHVTKTTLEVTDANRAVVTQWAAQNLENSAEDYQRGLISPPGMDIPASNVALIPANILDPSAPAPDDPMGQALYEGATSSHTVYDVDSSKFSLSGSVALGVKLGLGYSSSQEDQSVVSSTYLASPSAPGAPRQREANPVCN